jgi:transcriptional regulator with XRE-family HTH domain
MASKQKSAHKKPRGRPAGSQYAGNIPCRLAPQVLAAVDEFSRREKVTRSEAIRRLIEFALAVQAARHLQAPLPAGAPIRNRGEVTIKGRSARFHLNRNTITIFLPIQCRMARAALGLGVRDLAAAAKVSVDTVARFERGEELKERTLEALQRALESTGVEFTNGDQPGVRLRKGARPHAREPASEPKATVVGRSGREARK